VLRYLLLVLGLFTVGFLVWHVGPGNIYRAAAQLGPFALLVILIPSVLMYLVEAYGWKVTLGPAAQAVPFWRLLVIRTAGEVVNMTTPTAYVGGEPLKAYFLKRHRVPMVEGLASVVIAKTTMTIAEVLFILVGIALGLWMRGTEGSSGRMVAAALLSVGLLMFGTAGFVFVQRRGLFTWILEMMRKLKLRIAFLESKEGQLAALDRTILSFYRDHQAAFYASTGLYFLGWMAESLEVYVIMFYLGSPADPLAAISIGALSVFIKGGTFFIPGSLGAQDAGNLLLLTAFGYSSVTGVTFALLRRFREVVVGLVCLAAMGKPRPASEDAPGAVSSGPPPP
jgi:glycosyltransferase 2 family protein